MVVVRVREACCVLMRKCTLPDSFQTQFHVPRVPSDDQTHGRLNVIVIKGTRLSLVVVQ